MVSQLAQLLLVRTAAWLTAAMLVLPVWPGGACACAAPTAAAPAHSAAGARATQGACCCCAHRGPSDADVPSTCGATCHCRHASAPPPPAAPASQAHSVADQLLVLQAASAPLTVDAQASNSTSTHAHDVALPTGSALDRCVSLSRLIL